MKYGKLPHFDQPVSRLVIGVIPLIGLDKSERFALLDAYREAGGNAIDNSFHYGERAAEVMREYWAERGEDALIRLDKGNHHHGDETNMKRRVTSEDIENDVAGNLERQGTTYSHLYALHRDDPSVPAGQVVEWLNEQMHKGRIRAFGGSNWRHERFQEGNEYAEKHGLQGFSFSSPNLSLASANEPMWTEALAVDAPARQWYASTGFPLIPWSSAGGGFFAGVENGDIRRVYHNEVNFARRERCRQLAAKKSANPVQIALAWTLAQPGEVFPIFGAKNLGELMQYLAVMEIELTREEVRWLEFGDGASGS